MAYRLQRDESVHHGIRRIAREELESAATILTGRTKRDQAIHEARKGIKKTRALLRLVRYELGDVFRSENIRLRDAGRSLSAFRDAAAIIGTFDDLRGHYKDDLGAHKLDSVRQGLLLHKKRGERQANIREALKDISATLARTARRVAGWPLETDGFPAIAPGLEKTYRDGRDAMVLARKKPRPENFHEWRKRVKDHWYHIRLLEDLWTDLMTAREKSLHDLEDWVGTDHNLIVLRSKVTADPAFFGTPEEIALLDDIVDRYLKKLRDDSLEVGARIYGETPGRFRKGMKDLWTPWQS